MTTRYGALGSTHAGRTGQINRAYKGLGADMKRKQAIAPADCDEPQTLEQALRVIASLRNQLTEAQSVIDEMRTLSNSDAPPAAVITGYWTTAVVAEKSHVAICTIIRNVDVLGGWQLENGNWLFPAGTTYGRRRKAK